MSYLKPLLAVGLLVLPLLAACQGAPVADVPAPTAAPTDTPEPTSTPEPTATPTVTSTPTATPTPTNTPTPTPVMLTEDQLAELMLTLDDLSAGFTIDETGTGPVTREQLVEEEAVITLGYLDEAGDWASYEAAFERLSLANMAFVISWVLAFDSEEQAADYVSNYLKFFTSVEYEPISFPQLGEERVAYKGTIDAEGFEFDAYNIAIRRRNVVTTLRYGGLAALVDTEEVTRYAEILDERLEQVVSGE